MILRLLIVDDDQTLAGNLRAFFERQKYKVEMASDGHQAVELAASFRPHLIFLDIGLPGMSGIEVLKQVKTKDPSVRVIMITGQTETELVRQAQMFGADDYVTKPFTLDYLKGEVLDKLHKQLFIELRSASQYLAIEREKAELLFQHVNEGVMLFDPQGSIFMANPMARKILGLPDDLSAWTALRTFESFQADRPDWSRHLDAEKGDRFDLLRENPSRLILECRLHPILTPKNERFGYLLLFRDVTMDRKADTAMHHFISLISHKLRTPLVTIRAYPDLLMGESASGPLNDFQRNALQTIATQCRRMEDMVNQLIAFSTLDANEIFLQRMSLAELVHEALKSMPGEYQDRRGHVALDESLPALYACVDPTLVRHAIRNVLENAFKFGASRVAVGGEARNGAVILSVRDDGCGIPPEDRERIFDRFYQVEQTFCGQVPGAGLGLTMVRQTVESHGGKVWVQSQVDKGSTFFLQFPKAE